MKQKLMDFVKTLPEDIQEEVEGKKPLGVIRKLERMGIRIPNDILEEFEREEELLSDHQRIMDTMRPFMGNDVRNIPGVIVKI